MAIRKYQDIQLGEKAVFGKTITESDIWAFSAISGDFNPIHVDEEYAKASIFKTRIAHGLLTAALLDNTLGELTGEGAIHISQELRFLAPVFPGDTIKATSEVVEKVDAKHRLIIKTIMENQRKEAVLEGTAVVKQRRE